MNELMKKEDTSVSTEVKSLSVGTEASDLMQDYLVPRLLLQQGLSEAVSNGEAFVGDVIRSTTGEAVFTCVQANKTDTRDIPRVSRENPIRIIPLGIRMVWTKMELINEKWEYRGNEPRNAQTAGLAQEYEENGTQWRRYATIDVFALLERDIDAELADESSDGMPDLSKMLLPVYLSFRSTSLKAGKEISTYFSNILSYRAKGKNIFPFSFSLPVWVEKTENDKGVFGVWKASQATKPVSTSHFEKAQVWFENITKGFVKVDEVVESEHTAPSQDGPKF